MSSAFLPIHTLPRSQAHKIGFNAAPLGGGSSSNPLADGVGDCVCGRRRCLALAAGTFAYVLRRHAQGARRRRRRRMAGRLEMQQASTATRLSALGRMSSDLAKAFGGSDEKKREQQEDNDAQLQRAAEDPKNKGGQNENWFAAKSSATVDIWTAAGAVSKRQESLARKEKAKLRYRSESAEERVMEEVVNIELLEADAATPQSSYRLLKLLKDALASDDNEDLLNFLQEDGLLVQPEVQSDCHPVARSLSGLAQTMPAKELQENTDLLVEGLPKLSVADVMIARLWHSAWSHPIHCRLLLLDAIASRGGTQAWQACGVKLPEVAAACVQFAQSQAEGKDPITLANAASANANRQSRWGRRPQASYAKYAQWHYRRASQMSEDALPTDSSLAEGTEPSREAAELGGAQVARILQQLASTDALSSLTGKEAAMLFRTASESLGPAIQHILHPILRDLARNQRYDDDTMIALAMSLPDAVGRTAWPKLSGAVLAYWQTLWSDALFDRLADTPYGLQSGPKGFEAAFLAEVAKPSAAKVLARVTPAQLEQLLWLWESRQCLTATACAIIQAIVKKQLCSLSATQLITVSRTQAGRVPRTVLVQWWQQWTAEIVSGAAILGCGRCREALREVAAWSKGAADPTEKALAEEVLDDILCTALKEQMKKEAFTPALLLDMCMVAVQRAKQASSSQDIAAELEAQLQRSAAQPGGALPLVMSLKIVSGETPLPCTSDSPLRRALVSSIASRLHSERGLDMFKQYRPDRSLILEVMSEMEDGDRRRLELAWLLQRE